MRRGGLNHVEGLRLIKTQVSAMDLPIHVYGPESPITGIIPMALGSNYQIHAHEHGGFWQPIRNLREWYESNLSICSPDLFRKMYAGASDLIDVSKDQVFTVPRTLPPARFTGVSDCER